MDESLVHEILNQLISSLEPLETQSAALLQLLKDKGIATDEALAPYLEQAGNASSVRWRAFRVRTEALISSALNPPEPEQKLDTQKPEQKVDRQKREASEKEPASNAPAAKKPAPEKPALKKEDRAPQATAGREQEAQPPANSAAKPAEAPAKTQAPEQETKPQPDENAA